MPQNALWTAAAKFFIASIVALLLATGLCAYGGGIDNHATQTQVTATYAGAILALLAFLFFLIACNEVGRGKRKRWPR